jgi:hypothetical protein
MTPPTEAQSSTEVDEQKLEQEYGLPPNEMVANKPRLSRLLLLPFFKHNNLKREHLLLLVALLVIVVAGATSFTILHFDKPAVIALVLPSKRFIPVPTTVASTLSGLPVSPSVNNQPVTAVMVENSTFARPQSGLDQAGVVFEALAEGGITRFMALFQDTQPNYIGPVRSVRPYYIEWALGFDASIAHVGGSPDGLQDITTFHVKDLNEFYNAAAYERISSRDAPHNVYTSIAQLNQLETKKGFGKSNYTGFLRKIAIPLKTPNATSINVTFSSTDYNVHYDYDATTNSYKRSEGGTPHMELNKDGSQTQITPKVVIAMVVPYSLGVLDSTGARYSVYGVVGSGAVSVFQDGTVTTGTWAKTSNATQITFTNASGKPLLLNPGQTWIESIAGSQDLSYT